MVTVHGLPDGLQIPRSMGSMGKAKMAELLAVIPNLKIVLNIASSTLPEQPHYAAEEMSSDTSSMPQVLVMDDEDTLSLDEEGSLPLTNTSEVQPSGSATAMLNYLAGGGLGVAPVLPLPMPRPAVFSKKSSIRDNKGSAFKKSVNPRVSREEELGVRMKNTKSRVGMRKKKSAKLDADEQLSEDVAKLASSNQGIVEKI
ncbi:uncharacterized protein LOC135498596 [Lineus longissimus]|uniref:uncharacterized protein LOC135498596 n=1 Tax=Lineus longissimus TaxID=88925 RepID=UPI00315DD266